MTGTTHSTSAKEIVRTWHHVDVENKILGRVAGEIAHLLMGKKKPYFVRNLDCGDYVVITNAAQIVVTGKKEQQKTYYRHSGYPGGLHAETVRELRARRPEEIIRRAVKGMLPQTRLRDRMLKRLFVFKGADHTYSEKFAKVEKK